MFTKVLTRTFVGALTVLLITAVNVQVGNFMATSQGADIRLEWSVANESGVKSFDIYKKLRSEQHYNHISSVNPMGQKAYVYLDDDSFKNNESLQDIYYKLSIKSAQGNTNYYSSVQQGPTVIERTWASIKSMFK